MQLEYIHNKLKDNNEIIIAYKYSYIAKRYTVILTGKTISDSFCVESHIFSLVSNYKHCKLSR